MNITDTTNDWLLDYKKTIAAIEGSDYAQNTKKLMYIVIKSTLRDMNDARFGNIIMFYDARMMAYNAKIKEQEEKQQLNPTESKKYVDWNTILDVREKLRKRVELILEKDESSVELMNITQNYIIVCLYTMIEPVRLDYAEMMVVESKPAKLEGNYLVWNKRPYFVFSQYKTSRKYGVVTRPVPAELKKVLTWWFSMNPTGYLLIDRNGNAMNDISLCQRVISIFTKELGSRVGVSQIRHSYVTYMRSDEMPLKEQQEMAKNMLHSVPTSVTYRRLKE